MAVDGELTTSKRLEPQIKSVDMSEDMQAEAIEVAQEAMEKFTLEKDIAQHVKREFDAKKGATWHCIVGRNFGSFVTHEQEQTPLHRKHEVLDDGALSKREQYAAYRQAALRREQEKLKLIREKKALRRRNGVGKRADVNCKRRTTDKYN
ncbi:Dynein light chain [Elasticomyces elasticus]|nr:Dynein light chain [Elasticomyces elasticus]